MKCKNTIAMVLAGAMLLPSNAFAADLSQYKDFPNDWSAKSLEQAIDDGLLNGSNGMIDAKGLLTRAQMAAIVSRSFGAAKTASLDDYRDVLPSAWYYSDMGKAVKMGAFQGANGLLNPDAPITREEAFTVLARAFALEGGGSATLKDFVDGGTVSSWASESVAALVAGGYVNGANGMLNLKNNITRAEFAKVITGMAASYVGAEGVSSKTVEGNVIVRESGASLSGMTINGDLIIADGADKVSLDGVKVTGRIVVRGASTEASLKNSSAGKGVLVSNPNGAASLSVSGGSVGTVTAKSDLVVSGSVDNIVIAEKAALTVQSGASVGSVTVSAAGASVSGAGTVSAVQANANNVTVSTKNTKVTAASGVSGVKAGDKTVSSGKTETVGTTTSSGGSSSGGSSSSRSDYSYVLMNIPYDEFYKAELSENAPAVDAVTSATKNKTRSALAAGSYHVNADGSDITGVIYPVRVKTSDLSDLTQVTDSSSVSITTTLKGNTSTIDYTGKDALFQSASHSYYYLSSAPSSYKEATFSDGKWTFGKATGAASEGTVTIAKFKTSGHHADYEIKIDSDKITKGQKVYAVVVTDTDGNSYGLRHVAEIWHAIELGFKADSALVGKTISAVTYYTDDGVIKLNLAEKLHVPYIAEGAKAEVAKSDADAKSTTLSLTGFPKDFEPSVTVPKGMEYDKTTGTITFNSALPGAYEVTVSDANGKYAPVKASFTVSTNMTVAQYDSESVSLKAADKANDAALANYLNNITSVKVGDKEYAATGKDAVTIINSNGYLDLTAEPFAEMKSGSKYTITVKANYYKDQEFNVTIPEHIYAYAAVPYDEYWQSEGVYLNEDSKWDDGSDTLDGHNEYDKGAFDAVSRATSNHGLHRGSFQQSVIIHTKDHDKDYHPVAWTDRDNFVDADGKTYNKNEIGIASYNITGIKYVPVKVKSDNFAEFCKHYTVTQNGETLQGGFSENNLNAYTAVAAVDSTTNGLKEVTLGTTNGYTFGKRKTGTGSGIKGETLKTADKNIKPEAKTYSGNFGEMLRVDLDNTQDATKYYGDLGGHMQTVVWKYYGNGEDVLATYGTKFAADNWMHKFMGIQLGLTDSLRAKLPAGHDGTGKWTITVYALGYSDTTYTVQVTADNLPKKVEPMTKEQRKKLESLRDEAKALLDLAADQNNLTPKETELKKHYNEIVALLAKSGANTEEAKELIDEVPGLITDVKTEREKPTTKPTTTKVNGEAKVTGTDGKFVDGSYQAKITVVFDADGKVVSITDNGTAPGDSNASFWNNALAMFDKLIGKTKDDVDSVDAVSNATVSSNAIKAAVKDALSK